MQRQRVEARKAMQKLSKGIQTQVLILIKSFEETLWKCVSSTRAFLAQLYTFIFTL